ncbi:DUF167 domain-containing protein [Candidatus Woesearchaeota archaeon]|nr:DUF167 domain-containing protein [Candidatus Woesearchaeota archaeon]
MDIKETKFKIIAKPNSRENKIECFDKERNAYRISIKAKPENNKANLEIIKFLSKLLKRKVKIASGLNSREKIIEIVGQTNKYLKQNNITH